MLEGVLFFPVTPFTPDDTIHLGALSAHVREGVDAGAGGVFVACGTGEFHALDLDEYAAVVRTAVEASNGRTPVFAGAGGPLPLARQYARAAQQAGVDGLLLMPPYLVTGPPSGTVAYVRDVVESCSLPAIVYQRGSIRLDVPSALEVARLPQVIGLKDGTGDMDLLARIVTAVREDPLTGGQAFQFFNGMPTAEGTVLAYRGIGVDLYSSAVFSFAPDIALAFHRAVTTGDDDLVHRLLHHFFHPLIELRERVPGYAVGLVKAGVRLRGLDVGGVRPPLTDPTAQHLAVLKQLIAVGADIIAGSSAPSPDTCTEGASR
ncbi:5-dehydro-4-deoxyglucarate dehydratase [Streptomyces zhihengii]|uniref:5-dehydro-4-deoxyglucarate dehydratase n=1 Tax=Streptomyces zhihengii TaxID=1818004 RepID=UPI0033A573BF